MAKVDGELQGIHDQIKALLKEEEDRKERRRKEEEAGVMTWRTLLLLKKQAALRKLGFGWEVGKRRKVARQGRFSGGGGSSGGGRLDVEEVIRQLHLLSDGRSRVQSEEDLSGLSDENSGGAADCAGPFIGDSVLTPCG